MMFSHEFTLITCFQKDCGITFAVPKWWKKGKLENHSWFYCPNGHYQHYPAESESEKACRERDIAKQQLARAEQEAAEARRETVKVTAAKKRLEKRAAAGNCPCCKRTFSNMSVHMRKKHPEFVADNVVKLEAGGKK